METSIQELDGITTEWAIVRDPAQFVMRYAIPIQKYFAAIIRNPHDAEEVAQDFLMRVVQHGFVRVRRDRGRFRDYLRTAVRNSALNFLQRKRPAKSGEVDLAQVPATGAASMLEEQEWGVYWRRCLMNRAWRGLREIQRRSPDNYCYSALRVAVVHRGEDSHELAARLTELLGRPMRADAFRKQVSRARRRFAELLVQEVKETLDDPAPERVQEELIEVGLMNYVRDSLPADWRPLKKAAVPSAASTRSFLRTNSVASSGSAAMISTDARIF